MQRERGEAFRALHAGDPFVIPNPWDAGSARVLASLGFRALATTSSGFAFTLGLRDGQVTPAEVAEHVASLVGTTDLPVSVDLEDCWGDPETVIELVAEAGAVGGSIEDWDRRAGILPLPEAVARVEAAVTAARALPFPFVLTARAENLLHGIDDLDDTVTRLQAFEAAGADVLYAPGLETVAQIRAVCGAVSKPVNVLARPSLRFAEIAAAGAQRVSVGGALTWTAATALIRAATAIRDDGDFSQLGSGASVRDALA
jgi:2-methylisocitrate lyase-like PEP mutase family enzyme